MHCAGHRVLCLACICQPPGSSYTPADSIATRLWPLDALLVARQDPLFLNDNRCPAHPAEPPSSLASRCFLPQCVRLCPLCLRRALRTCGPATWPHTTSCGRDSAAWASSHSWRTSRTGAHAHARQGAASTATHADGFLHQPAWLQPHKAAQRVLGASLAASGGACRAWCLFCLM